MLRRLASGKGAALEWGLVQTSDSRTRSKSGLGDDAGTWAFLRPCLVVKSTMTSQESAYAAGVDDAMGPSRRQRQWPFPYDTGAQYKMDSRIARSSPPPFTTPTSLEDIILPLIDTPQKVHLFQIASPFAIRVQLFLQTRTCFGSDMRTPVHGRFLKC